MRLLDELHRVLGKDEGNDLGQDNTSASSGILGLGKFGTRLCCFFFRPLAFIGGDWGGLIFILLFKSDFEACGAFLFVSRCMQLNSSRDIFWFDGHGKECVEK